MEFRAIYIVSYKHNERAELDQIWQEDIPGANTATGCPPQKIDLADIPRQETH
jgi:hypothetical protein